MGKNIKNKKIIVVLLLLSIMCLSIGFALFSSTLNINSEATVTPDASGFNVSFSTSSSELINGQIEPTSNDNELTLNSSSASISEDGKTISNLNVYFTEPGQNVDYNFYLLNVGQYDAYLRSAQMHNANGYSSPIVCIPEEGTTDDLVQKACKAMSVEITGIAVTNIKFSPNFIFSYQNNNAILKNSFIPVTVKVSYNSNGVRADGPFTVKFGNISIGFSSVSS